MYIITESSSDKYIIQTLDFEYQLNNDSEGDEVRWSLYKFDNKSDNLFHLDTFDDLVEGKIMLLRVANFPNDYYAD